MNERTIAYQDAPWSVPVPTRAADFTSVFEQHADCAVVAALGDISPFEVPSAEAAAAPGMLWSDLQLPPEFPTPGRLGSGRAGCKDGFYLKGIGRTQLAANWSTPKDAVHASGHMHASAAVRELLATAYLRAKQLAHTVVPCEGALFRRMDPSLCSQLERQAAALGHEPPPVDGVIQAISVKPAGFARWSNILWLAAYSRGSRGDITRLARLLTLYARPADSSAAMPSETTAASIAKDLVLAIDRGYEAHRSFFASGVYWGSFCNNMTLDGRFLDLEVPLFLCEPICCAFDYRKRRDEAPQRQQESGIFFGTELLEYVAQTRAALSQLLTRLRFLADHAEHPTAGAFANQLADAVDAAFSADHWLRSRTQVCARLRELMASGACAPTKLTEFVVGLYDERMHGGRYTSLPTDHIDLGLARPEPSVYVATYLASESRGEPLCQQAASERTLINDLLRSLDRVVDVDELIEGLRDALATISLQIAPALSGVAQ